MRLRVNGEERVDVDVETVAALLVRLGLADATCAVAVNREFVPRGEHATKRLRADDEIEIVAPMAGG